MGVTTTLAPAPAKASAKTPMTARPPLLHVRQSARLLQRACDCGATAGFSGRCADCDRVSLKPRIEHAPGADLADAERRGVPLTPLGRGLREGAPAGHDLGRVAIHPAAKAAASSVAAAPAVRQTSPVRVQTQLRVSSPSDPAEQEAHSMGKMIAGMATTEDIAGKPAVGQTASGVAQREIAPAATRTSADSYTIHRREAGAPTAEPDIIAALLGNTSAGSALPRDLLSFMEPRFGADFSSVRVHTDEHAARLCAQLSARAFTIGRDIYFAKGQYRPDTAEGWQLIAHELTHTIQQGSAPRVPPKPVAVPPEPSRPATSAAAPTAAPGATPAAAPAPTPGPAKTPGATAGRRAAAPLPGAMPAATRDGGLSVAPLPPGARAPAAPRAKPTEPDAIGRIIEPGDSGAPGAAAVARPVAPTRAATPVHAPVPVHAAEPGGGTPAARPAAAAASPEAAAAPRQAAPANAAAPASVAEPVRSVAPTAHGAAPAPASVPAHVADKAKPPPAPPRAATPVRPGAPARPGEIIRPTASAARVSATASPSIQRFGIDDALGFFADKANLIPGFRMLTIILGVNPINMSRVDRSAANILRALIEFIPGGGIITQALENSGVFDKVGAWVSAQIETLAMTGAALKQAVMDFLHSLSFTDIFDLSGVWDRAKRIFTEPIGRLIEFAKGLAAGILKFIKDAILLPLAKLAEGTRGWDLLIAVLGRNPITGDAVPRTAEALIGGFLKLIGQDEVWANMQKANAIPRAWAWFQGAMGALMGFVSQIPDLFVAAFKSLTVEDVVLVAGAFQKVASVFGGFLGKFIDWAGAALWNLLEIIFDAVSPGALTYVKKTGAALKSILKDPLPFVHNLVAAAKQGFENFAGNFGTHLKEGLIDWLTGSLPGVYIPQALTLLEFGKFALSVLGITWAQIRAKIVKALGPNGETIMKGLETAFDIVVALVKGGVAAAWELIKEKLTNLKDMVIDGIVGFVTDTIIKKAVPKLISLFVPGAGFISAILSIYDTIKVFIDKLAKIAAVVKGFIDSIVAIAAGEIGGAAKRVESALTGVLSVAISFLAGFLSLGNVASKVMDVVKKVRETVDKALDTAIGWIIGKAKALFAKLFGKDKEPEPDSPEKTAKIAAGLKQLHAEGQPLAKQNYIAREDAEKIAAKVKAENPVFTSLTVMPGDETWDYIYTASPSKKEKGDIPRRIVLVTLADLSAEEVPPTGGGSWDVRLYAAIPEEKILWGIASVPWGPDPTLPPRKPDHSMYISNEVTTFKGEPIKLQLKDGRFTDYALAESIKLYEARYGKLDELGGRLIDANLANFQAEFAKRRKLEMDNEPAAQAAIRAISFGRARVAIGFVTFEIARSGEKVIDIPGIGSSFVPTSVQVTARR